MKILVVCQYFWPENFRINDLVLGLKEKGLEIVVFTGKPNYPTGKFYKGYSMLGKSKEIWNGITIHRTPLITRGSGRGLRLFLNYLSFALIGSIKAFFLKVDADVILVYQQSPITAALPAFIFRNKTRARIYLYIQDLWPESIEATTSLKNKIVLKFLYRLCDWIYKSADTILIQSKAFRSYLVSRKVNPDRIIYLPNSTESFYKRELQTNEISHFFSAKTNIVFAGNIGEAQSFDTLIAAAKIVKVTGNDINWVIIGDGRRRRELEQLVKEMGIDDVFKFIGAFKPEMMPFFFAYADALLISLKKDFIFSLTIPSKLQSYMACGKPIIGSLDGEGQLIINGADCGLASAAEDASGLAKNVIAFMNTSSRERSRMGNNAFRYFNMEFDRKKLLGKLENIFKNESF